jgi:multicomponent Na+:H+ antiporter subunit B
MKKAFVAALLIITAIPLLFAVAELPEHGNPGTAVQTHISARYLKKGAEEAGTENIVTAVILNYRGLDTNGEVTVIFTALAAVMAVLLPVAFTAAHRKAEGTVREPPAVSVVVSFIVRLLAPFIVIFSVYVMINGHTSPGGGFQGGAILGGLFIVLSIVLGSEKVRPLLPDRAAPWLRIAAPLAFVSMGILGVLLTGFYLGFPQEPTLRAVSAAMILVIEIGIGVGGATIFATLYREMEAQ